MDFEGNAVGNEVFSRHNATVVNFWTNGCGACIAEMPDLETYCRQLKDRDINLIAVAVSAGDSDAMRARAQDILESANVTLTNVIPDPDSAFYRDFVCKITGFPATYVVDSAGNIIGEPILGALKNQESKLLELLETALSE